MPPELSAARTRACSRRARGWAAATGSGTGATTTGRTTPATPTRRWAGRGEGGVLAMTSDHVTSQWLVLNGAWNDDWGQVDGARNALEDVIDSLLCNEPEPHTTDPPPPPTTQHPPGTAAQIYR